MGEREIRERDILVGPNEYAYVQDLTKGNVILYVGPTKISLSNTERLIVLEEGRFVPVRRDDAGHGVHKFVEASSSQYVVLENPPEDETDPPVRGANSTVPLRQGRKVVAPGPAIFPLWPGQRAKVIEGHELRQNEYLVVRRYDDTGSDAPIGSETIVRGTEVSFYVPESGLEVVPLANSYRRHAIHLDPNMGLHLRFVSAFEADDQAQVPPGHYAAGQDYFLSGREGYFFPTKHIEVVGTVSPLPLAEKEAVYLRNLETGSITTVAGPTNLLIDPTKFKLVTRDLGPSSRAHYRLVDGPVYLAPTVDVPPCTAIMVTSKDSREVVIGPQTRILDYTEELETLTLSTGRPKNDSHLLTTCFLQVQGNRVSDQVSIQTADHVWLGVELSYRVSFVGDSARWFDVKNYVGLLVDHLRSLIRGAARNVTIDAFHGASTETLRNAILGKRDDGGSREGRLFEENGMWVYDVEVLHVGIEDEDVAELLYTAQQAAIASTIERRRQALRMGDREMEESVNRQIAAAQIQTLAKTMELEEAQRIASLAEVETMAQVNQLKRVRHAQSEADAIGIMSNARAAEVERMSTVKRAELAAQVGAFEKQMAAIQPELINTLKQLGNAQLVGDLSKNLSPLAILGGESVADVAERLLDHLPMGMGGAPSLHNSIQGIMGQAPTAPGSRRSKAPKKKTAS